MEENKNIPQEPVHSVPEPSAPFSPVPPQPVRIYAQPPRLVFHMGKRELIFGICVALFSMLMCNSLFYAGANLGFALGAAGILLSTTGYLHSHGHRAGRYTRTLLILSLLILAAFPRSADNGMKVLMVCVILAIPSLSFCLMAGQNLRDPAGIASLLDAPRVTFSLGMGGLPASGRGIRNACRSAGSASKAGGAVLLGLLIAIPVLLILVPLLMSADAAFEGLLDQMPEFRFGEFLTTLILGGAAGYFYFGRGAALHHAPRSVPAPRSRKGLNAVTVNTVLLAVAFVYGVYLFSQLAYLVGGFSGLLPEEYTIAQYARRGFFEMGWLCAINLGLIGLSVGLVTARREAPLLTKVLCLFLGFVTLFLVAAASAKMLLYIGSYGLTQMRLLTEIFMIWLALTTVFVCIWLFVPKLPYMKFSTVLALALCAGLMWADVDTMVARYNVRAYQSGKMETVDMEHLSRLNNGAVPYLYELTLDRNEKVALAASKTLRAWDTVPKDIRSWNYSTARAEKILSQFRAEDIGRMLELELIPESLEVLVDTYAPYGAFGEYAVVLTLTEKQGETLEAALMSREDFPQKSLPLALQALLYPHSLAIPSNYRGPYFRSGDVGQILPQIEKGFWFFQNRTPSVSDPNDYASLHSTPFISFTLALYDAETNTLYFFMKDH